MDDLERHLASLDAVPQRAWERLAARRIWFGHQSVGFNIIEGVLELLRARPSIALRVIESDDPRPADGPALIHARLGANVDPDSKIRGFAERMDAGIGAWADIALFKLCYADIHAGTDVAAVASRLIGSTDAIARRFPDVALVHCTVPLTALPSAPKRWAKRLLGKPVREFADNAKRAEFNGLLRDRHGRMGLLFDIARIESTRPDGRPERNGTAMHGAYTADRGHLNARGRLAVAAEFLRCLAEVPT